MARPAKGFWFFLLGLLGMSGGAAHAGSTGVLCNSDIQGESEVPGATGCIDVLAWSWGLSSGGGSGGGTSLPSLQDISLTKYVDSSSEDLMRLVATQTPIKGVVEFNEYVDCASGCPSGIYLSIHMKGVTVSSQSSGGTPSDSRHTENITLSFDEISYCYSPTVKGALGTPQCYAYSRQSNSTIPQF
ncbi:MAG: type VI secretion system tube protein Hcp [Rhodanobacteraceae bacterium]